MPDTLFHQLARHLDTLPGGYPETASGVEIGILKLLFTETEAFLATHLTLISETADVISLRSGYPLEAVRENLRQMAIKGLILREKPPGKPETYMALHFVVGIWEFQVNRLTPQLVAAMDEYMPSLLSDGAWQKMPQMRVIPIAKNVSDDVRVMTHEDARSLIRRQNQFVVADCICRKERAMAGHGCEKPLSTCLSFGDDESFYLRTGAGKKITQSAALNLVDQADANGLVLQPSNSKDAGWICFCCGCCCGILRNLKKMPNPSEVTASSFVADLSPEICVGCGLCVKRCPMDAISLTGKRAEITSFRCIGCGLCVSSCPTNALAMERRENRKPVPMNIVSTMVQLGWKRKKITPSSALALGANSLTDRLKAKLRK